MRSLSGRKARLEEDWRNRYLSRSNYVVYRVGLITAFLSSGLGDKSNIR